MPATTAPSPPVVLSFSASDATGGGDLQSDVLTLASMGCHPLSVVAAITVRDTRGVDDLVALEPDLVVAQARAVLEDIPVRAFKLGMAGSVENLAAIAEILSDYPEVPLVLEPVLGHLDGDEGANDEYLEALAELILPQTTLLVAGSHEIWRMAGLGSDDEDEEDVSDGDGVARVLGLGAEHVLLTGGGQPGPQYVNVLYGPRGIVRTDAWERHRGQYLGARATLSAAVAAELAHGTDLREAVREAQEFTWHALGAAYRPGMGLALPDRFFWTRDEGPDDA